MKTAISLPDQLFAEADLYAQQQDMSRSELYAKALGEYLDKHKADNITEKINVALSKIHSQGEKIIGEYGLESLRRLPW